MVSSGPRSSLGSWCLRDCPVSTAGTPLSLISNLPDTRPLSLSLVTPLSHNWHTQEWHPGSPSQAVTAPLFTPPPSQSRRCSDAMNWISNLIVVGPFSVEVEAINCPGRGRQLIMDTGSLSLGRINDPGHWLIGPRSRLSDLISIAAWAGQNTTEALPRDHL